jgi:hypothetical protein
MGVQLHFGADDVPFNIPLKRASKSVLLFLVWQFLCKNFSA